MFNKRKVIISLIAAVLLAAPILVLAAPLVTCGTRANPDPCTLCDLWKMISDLMFFFIFKVAFPVAGLLFVYAGVLFLFAGAKPGNVETARSIFFNVIIGLCIILLAWLTVDTLIKTLVPKEGNEARTILWAWNKFPPCK